MSGLLNSLDGVAASTGRLLFATTNHYERLDPALTRPVCFSFLNVIILWASFKPLRFFFFLQGRLDVHVDFKHASKWQAEGIFMNFYPTKPKIKKDETALMDATLNSASVASAPPLSEATKRKNPAASAIPLLEEEELSRLAKQFAAQIPEDEMSVRIHSSSILLLFEPESCVSLGFVHVSCCYELLCIGPVLPICLVFGACDVLYTPPLYSTLRLCSLDMIAWEQC